MSATTIAVAIWVADIFGFIAYRMMVQRDRARALVRDQDIAMRLDARRIQVLRDDNDASRELLVQAAWTIRGHLDTITLLRAENARLTIERDHARTTLEIQIADPRDRMALLPSNVVALRKAGQR